MRFCKNLSFSDIVKGGIITIRGVGIGILFDVTEMVTGHLSRYEQYYLDEIFLIGGILLLVATIYFSFRRKAQLEGKRKPLMHKTAERMNEIYSALKGWD